MSRILSGSGTGTPTNFVKVAVTYDGYEPFMGKYDTTESLEIFVQVSLPLPSVIIISLQSILDVPLVFWSFAMSS